jgi:uncharacterized metal-binding protein YceD (DUF177 family)
MRVWSWSRLTTGLPTETTICGFYGVIVARTAREFYMRGARSGMMTKHPWSVPVRIEEVPEAGLHLELAADAGTRALIARLVGVQAVARLEAAFDVARKGERLRVTGRVSGTVGQTCVVSLEPMVSVVEEAVNVVFAPVRGEDAGPEDLAESDMTGDEPPEPLIGGTADLGAVATEFLLLGIDPYPRKPDAVFAAPPAGEEAGGPFAALAALKEPPKQGG